MALSSRSWPPGHPSDDQSLFIIKLCLIHVWLCSVQFAWEINLWVFSQHLCVMWFNNNLLLKSSLFFWIFLISCFLWQSCSSKLLDLVPSWTKWPCWSLALMVWLIWWCAGGVNLPYCSTHEYGRLCGGDSVMVMSSQLWWCSWCDVVGGVVLLVLVGWCSWPCKFTSYDVFIPVFVPWGLDTSAHAFDEWAAVSLLALLSWPGIFSWELWW
jgi:hypothetical protein